MEPVITATVETMTCPTKALRDEALAGPAGRAAHDALVSRIPALRTVEVRDVGVAEVAPARMTVAAWNLERCKYLTPTIDLLRRAGADLLLLSEMDHGMARSGNRHTTREIAAALGMAYVFATEFVEIGLGDERETRWHAGSENEHGLHGNAILSRWPLRDMARVALDDGGDWFSPDAFEHQRRIGGRCAVFAMLDTENGPLGLISLHLESHSDAEDRAAQVGRVLDFLGSRVDGPVLVAGDFNTAALPHAPDPAAPSAPWFVAPGGVEPMFDRMAAQGFDWQASNTPEATCRMRPDGSPKPPFRRIDWFFVRGASASDPRVWPAVDEMGNAISDHELLTVDIAMV